MLASLIAMAACTAETTESASDLPEPTEEVDYARCSTAACEGPSCVDADAMDAAELFIDAVSDAGLDDVVELSSARLREDLERVSISYRVRVGWFQTQGFVHVERSDSDDAQRRTYADELEGLELPAELAPLQVVEDAIFDCLGVELDPCTDLRSDFTIRAERSGPEGCAWIDVAEVDVHTGALLSCREEPVSCG